MTFWEQLARFEQREQKYAEAAGLNYAANVIDANESTLETYVDAQAPQTVQAVVAVVEKADAHLPQAVFINGLINVGAAALETQLQPIVAQGGALLPNFTKALRATAVKLEAEAAAL